MAIIFGLVIVHTFLDLLLPSQSPDLIPEGLVGLVLAGSVGARGLRPLGSHFHGPHLYGWPLPLPACHKKAFIRGKYTLKLMVKYCTHELRGVLMR